LLLNMELVATVALAATLFREHLGRNMITAALLVTTAGVLLVWEPGAAFDVDALLIVGACMFWGLDNSVTSRIDQVSPQHVTFLKGVVAGSVNLALGLAITGAGSVSGWAVAGALVVGAFGYGASITLWVRGSRSGDLRDRPVHWCGAVMGRFDRFDRHGATDRHDDRRSRGRTIPALGPSPRARARPHDPYPRARSRRRPPRPRPHRRRAEPPQPRPRTPRASPRARTRARPAPQTR
jgi:hypothetical protein